MKKQMEKQRKEEEMKEVKKGPDINKKSIEILKRKPISTVKKTDGKN